MNTYSAKEDADYSWEGEEDGWRGHSHVVICEAPDGRVGRAYGNGVDFEPWEIEELCADAEDNLPPLPQICHLCNGEGCTSCNHEGRISQTPHNSPAR